MPRHEFFLVQLWSGSVRHYGCSGRSLLRLLWLALLYLLPVWLWSHNHGSLENTWENRVPVPPLRPPPCLVLNISIPHPGCLPLRQFLSTSASSSSVLCWRWEEEEEEQRCSESPSSRPSLWIFTILTFFLRSHCGERRFLAGYIILYCHVGVCESQHDWAVLQWHNVKVKTHRKFRKPPKRKPRDRTSDLLAVRQTYEPLFFHPCEPYHFIILSAILLFLSLSVFALTRTKPIKPKVQTLRLLLQNARLSLHERCLWHVDHPPLIPV